jgi:hypothetical protein
MDMSPAGLSFAALMAAQLLAVIAVRRMRLGDDHSSTEGLVRKPRRPDLPSILVPPDGDGTQTRTAGQFCFAAVLIGAAIGIVLGPPQQSSTATSYLRSCKNTNDCPRLDQTSAIALSVMTERSEGKQ